VRRDASRPDIKAAVELMFEVQVAKVNVVNVAGKRKRFGQRAGRRQDFKKAYVSLAPGQSIDLSGAEA
jgi:large subunit ribosomal protein L23